MRPSDFADYVKFCIETNEPFMVAGSPGVGKSRIVEDVCKDLGVNLIISHPVTSDPTDYKGAPYVATIDGTPKASFVAFGDLQQLIDAKDLTVFFLDDVGQAPGSVQASAMQLPLARRVNGHIISEQVRIFAATNRKEDQAGVQGILEPVKGRFTIVTLTPDEDDWIKWARKEGLPEELIAFVSWRKYEGDSVLYKFKPSRDMTNTPNPRNIAAVGYQMIKGLPKHLEFEVFAGRLGEGVANEFCKFLSICRDLPDPEWVIANPEKVKIPQKPDIMFALLSSLISRAKKETFANILKFAERLSNEFSVMLVKECVGRNKELTEVNGFRNWAINHKEIVDL